MQKVGNASFDNSDHATPPPLKLWNIRHKFLHVRFPVKP